MRAGVVRTALGVACLVLFLGHAFSYWRLPAVSALETYLYDVRVRFSPPGGSTQQVVIVDIDEKSLGELGRWPWSRDVLAVLMDQLFATYKIRLVGFDMVFSEPDDSSGMAVLERLAAGELKGNADYRQALEKVRGQLDYDRRFAAALEGRNAILGYYFADDARPLAAEMLPRSLFPLADFPELAWQFQVTRGLGTNLPLLQAAAAGAGHFMPQIDVDGSIRRVPLLVSYGGQVYEALSVAMVRQLIPNSVLQLGVPDPDAGIEWLEISNDTQRLRFPVDAQLATMVPFRGPERSFPYLSAVDVLKGRIPKAELEGRIVLVGTSAAGLFDLRNTPMGGTYPGVEIHANLIAGMLAQTFMSQPYYVAGIEGGVLLAIGCLLIFVANRMSPAGSSALMLALLVLAVGFNLWLWQDARLVVPLAGSLMLLFLLYGLGMAWGFFVESRSKRRFTALFGQYVPPELVEEMARAPESYSMNGRSDDLTILFSDIRDFTSLSEGLPPDELTHLMNEYLGAMTHEIQAHRGTLDKYIGDAIMAFWGAPVADPKHARHAVLAAMAMQKRLQAINLDFLARGWSAIRIGVGINTGRVTVGDMGSSVRKAYTVMGDPVNLASRLEALTRHYGVGIIVGEETRAVLPDFLFRELDRVRVKGKRKAVAIFEPWGVSTEASTEQLDALNLWHEFLTNYRGRVWDTALEQLGALPDSLVNASLRNLYQLRIEQLRVNDPGEDWDGVTDLLSK